MRRTVAAVTLMMLWAVFVSAGGDDKTTYGEGVTLQDAVSISELLAEPDRYLGEKVRVDGVVSAVCQHRGCWMQVKDPETNQAVRIKVEDGVIVFPPSAAGKRTAAEGIFEAVSTAPARSEEPPHRHGEDEAHQAECAGEPVGERIFLIRGTGAIVFNDES